MKRKPGGCQRKTEGSVRKPKGPRRESKGSKWSQKRGQGRRKGDQNASKNRSSEKKAKRWRNGGTAPFAAGPFLVHFSLKSQKNPEKTPPENRPRKSMENRWENDAKMLQKTFKMESSTKENEEKKELREKDRRCSICL